MEKTRGHKSSERSAVYHAFFAGLILAVYGIYKGSDLNDLGILIGAVCLPLMWYAGARTVYKVKHGEGNQSTRSIEINETIKDDKNDVG